MKFGAAVSYAFDLPTTAIYSYWSVYSTLPIQVIVWWASWAWQLSL